MNLPNEVILFARWFGRWAVPFFFMVSGYFLQKNYSKYGEKSIFKSILNLLLIDLVANLLFTPFRVYQMGTDWSQIFTTKLFTMDGHLWFINSLIIGYLFLWLLLEKKADNWLLLIANTIIVFSLLTNAYSVFLKIKSDKEFAMVILSLPFLIYGYKISQTDFISKRMNIYHAFILIILGFLMQTSEIILLYKYSGYSPHNQEFLLGTIFYSFGIFILALKIRINKDIILAYYGRKYSLSIYLYHPLVIFFITYIIKGLPQKYLPFALWINPLLCVIGTLISIRVIDLKAPGFFKFINGVY